PGGAAAGGRAPGGGERAAARPDRRVPPAARPAAVPEETPGGDPQAARRPECVHRRPAETGGEAAGDREGPAGPERAVRGAAGEGVVLLRPADAVRVPAGQPARPHVQRAAAA